MGQGLLAGPAGEALGVGLLAGEALGVGVGFSAVVHDIPSTSRLISTNPIRAFAESIRIAPPCNSLGLLLESPRVSIIHLSNKS